MARRRGQEQCDGHDCQAPVRPHHQRAEEPHQARADQRLPHPSWRHRPQHSPDDQRAPGKSLHRSLHSPQAGRHQD